MAQLVDVGKAYDVLSEGFARAILEQLAAEHPYDQPLSYAQKLVLVRESMWAYHGAIRGLEEAGWTEIPTPRQAIPQCWRNDIFLRDGNQCLNCGTPNDLHIDHVVPLALGGAHALANLQTLCRSCNSKKGARAIDYRPSWPPTTYDELYEKYKEEVVPVLGNRNGAS